MSPEDTYHIRIGEMARQFHFEITGERLQLLELPCAEAMERAMQEIRDTNTAVQTLIS